MQKLWKPCAKNYQRKIMGKHHDKILERLEQRKAATPNKGGYNTPGSMNKKKTGYIKRGKGR